MTFTDMVASRPLDFTQTATLSVNVTLRDWKTMQIVGGAVIPIKLRWVCNTSAPYEAGITTQSYLFPWEHIAAGTAKQLSTEIKQLIANLQNTENT